VRQRIRKRIDAGVFLQLRIGGEHDFHRVSHRHYELSETAPADRSHLPSEPAVPEESILPGSLEHPTHDQRPLQRYGEAFEQRIGWSELTLGADGTVAKLANVNLKHSL
jgi:hypothetical protein